MKLLNTLLVIISLIAMLSFIIITFLRIKTIRTKAKHFGTRKEVTDPLLYWFSYISAFLIIVIKIILSHDEDPVLSIIFLGIFKTIS